MAILLLALALTVAACAAEDETSDSETTTADASPDGTDEDGGSARETQEWEGEPNPRLAELQAEVAGMSFDERRAYLIEVAAEEEDGQFDWYGNTNLHEMVPQADEFEDITGISVNIYRGITGDVFQRILEEQSAGYQGGDAYTLNGRELSLLSDMGMLAPLDTPVKEHIAPAAVAEDWIGSQMIIGGVMWNTDTVPEDKAPTTWREALEYDGRLAFEPRMFEWFRVIVEDVLMAEEGLSEDEALDLFRQAAEGASTVRGTNVIGEMTAAGEYDIAMPVWQHIPDRLERDGAPVAKDPLVEPLFLRGPAGPSIPKATKRPAAALLWVDYVLTEGQEIFSEAGRVPSRMGVQGGVPDGVRILPEDFAADVLRWEDPEVVNEWESLYQDDILRGAQADVD